MEEKRKAEAIGGVYGSPYWVKQLYLGYHSLNLRLFVGEQQSNFKQSLSWMPDSTKQLTLRVNTDAPEKLTMRLDEKALETLKANNPMGLNNTMIGMWAITHCDRAEEAENYLSRALLENVSRLFTMTWAF